MPKGVYKRNPENPSRTKIDGIVKQIKLPEEVWEKIRVLGGNNSYMGGMRFLVEDYFKK